MGIKDFAGVVMNPVRQRIVQYLLLHGKGTAGEIGGELSDVPTASLYRHIKVLLDAGCIEVVGECQIRGTVEKTYGLVSNPMGQNPGTEEVSSLISGTLYELIASFQRYFAGQDVDFSRDLLSVSSSTLLLSDEEFMEMLGRIGAVLNDYVRNQTAPGRKQRQFTIISSPGRE